MKDVKEAITFLKVSIFFQEQEFMLNEKHFDSTRQSHREIGMEIREALRDKSRLLNNLTKQHPELATYISKCSHFNI